MSSKKTLVRNLFNTSKTYSRISGVTRMRPPTKPGTTPDAGDSGIRRRFLHKRAFSLPEIVPRGGNLMEKLRELSLSNNRLRLDEMLPAPTPEKTSPGSFPAVTVDDVKKLMRAAEMEKVKSKLRETGKNWVPLPEFVRLCGENSSDPEQGNRVANMLDEAGNVIVLGNFVCLKPEELTSAVAGLIPTNEPTGDPATRQEFEQLEIIKSDIDKRADDMVRRELRAGLGFVVAQTIGFFRLTFWELSWDVMEPICYYVSSTYFMAGYAFFIRTAKEPTFQGFYKSRFQTKQKRLIEMLDFDIDRFTKLQKMHRPDFTKSGRF
ncbi:Calcium uniporter protein 3 [Raphanus sativus]|uniref:Calcium uniporter protein 3, mitochondrial n=1 Tax=Raphanus sativus TaxID=3726 RepID=A0A6J0LIV1_RAPSA|nr:calcium uniporter protein 3, mitochondrial [Raphanus sativus]KAJ4887547.1 Calcium uniporter protein 3 [Raphanus sativus]